MDAGDKLLEMRHANYEAAVDRISDTVIRTLDSVDQSESDSESLIVLQIGTLQLLSTIAMSLASIQWMGISDREA